MIGLKIAFTGSLVMLISILTMRAVGRWPGLPIGLILVAAFYGGAACVVVGSLMAIWS